MTRIVLWIAVLGALTVLHPGVMLVTAGLGLLSTAFKRKSKPRSEPTVEEQAKVIVQQLFAELRA